jgi:hypothetical protein
MESHSEQPANSMAGAIIEYPQPYRGTREEAY